MSGPSVAGIGAYAPRLRIDADTIADVWGGFDARGIVEKAVPEADEDALTMAVEAADRALSAAGCAPETIDRLAFATTTPPMAEEDLTPRLANILGIGSDVATTTVTASTRAGTQALVDAIDAVSGEHGTALVVASDCPHGHPDSEIDHAAGAGSAAIVLDAGSGTVVDHSSYVKPYPGTRYRSAGTTETTRLGSTTYEREAYRAAITGAVERLEADPESVDAAAIQSPDGSLPSRVSGAIGVDVSAIDAAETVSTLGDTAAASALLGAAQAFDTGATRVLIVGFGSGAGADAIVVDGPVPVEASLSGGSSLSYPGYLRRRGIITRGEPDGGGAYVSVPSWRRTLPQRHRLLAGRCHHCGELAFPPDGSCQACHRVAGFEDVELPGTGTIEAVTVIGRGGAPPEFVEQQSRAGSYASAIVALDGPDGDTVSVPSLVVDYEAELTVGTPVEAVIRRIYRQEDIIRYGFKMRVVDEAQ